MQQQSAETVNFWLIDYIKQNSQTKSRYEIDSFLLESGYDASAIEMAWQEVLKPSSGHKPKKRMPLSIVVMEKVGKKKPFDSLIPILIILIVVGMTFFTLELMIPELKVFFRIGEATIFLIGTVINFIKKSLAGIWFGSWFTLYLLFGLFPFLEVIHNIIFVVAWVGYLFLQMVKWPKRAKL